MKLLDPTPEQIRASAFAAPFVQQNDPYAIPRDLTEGDDPSFTDAAVAAFKRDNVLYSYGFRRGVEDAVGADTDYDPEFNPYRWMKDNLHEDVLADLADEIDQGYYDYVGGPKEMQSTVVQHMYEKSLLKEQEGQAIASFLGSAAGAVADPLILLGPEALAARGAMGLSKAVRIGVGSATTMGAVGVQEMALHNAQDLRTWKESLMNIGVSGAFVGGLGAFGVALQKGGLLHPESSINPMRPENLREQGVEAHVVGMEGNDVILPGSVANLSAASAGDMGISGPAPRKLMGTGAGSRLAEKIGQATAMRFGTPVGRALRWTSDIGVNTVIRLMDVGGVLTDTNRFGKRTGLSAEDIKRDYETLGNKVIMRADNAVRELSKELEKKMGVEDFWNIGRKSLNGTLNDTDLLGLAERYGNQNVDRIVSKVNSWAEEVHKTNELFESKLMEYGFLRDPEAVATLRARIDTLEQKIETDLAPLKKRYEDAKLKVKGLKGDERVAAQVDADRAKEELKLAEADQDSARGQLTTFREDLRSQLSLPKSLGRDYGYAQLWDDGHIITNHEAFEDFLLRALATTPDDDWLMEFHRLTADELESMKTADREAYDQIIRDWAGDASYFEIARLEKALKAAEVRAEDAKNEFSNAMRQLGLVRRDVAEVNVSEARAFRDRLSSQLEAARTAREAKAQEVRAFKAAAVAARQQTLDRQLAFTPDGRAPDVPELTPERARDEARAVELDKQLAREDAKVARAEARMERFESAYADVRAKLDNAKAARDFLKDYAEQVKKQRNLSAKNVAELKRKLKTAEKKVPLEEAVVEIRKNLSDRKTLPTSIMDRVVPESGRMKARRIMLTPEFRREAEEAGWLRTDLQRILPLQYSQLGGHLGIREAFDIRPGGRYQNWSQILDEIRTDYDSMKLDADPARRAALEAEYKNLDADIITLKDRLLGTEDLGIDPNSALAWTSRKVRQASFLRFGSTFLVSSLTDVATVALRHRMLPMIARYGKQALTTAVDSVPESNLQAMVYATEIGTRHMMMSSRIGDADLMNTSGFGVRGTTRQRVSGAIDLAGDKLTNGVLALSLMPAWNRTWKVMAGLQLNDELGKLLRSYDSIPDVKKTDLASLGIGRAEAEKLRTLIEKHGVVEDGIFDPRIENWIDEPGGADMARVYRVAIQRDMNRSILTLGIGDTPRIMDKWYGKVLLQFQSFAFKFTNAYLKPLIQRGAHFRDIQAAASFALLMASTAFVIALKDKMRGEDPAARYEEGRLSETAFEFVDRSGMMGYMSPYFQAGAKLAGLTGSSRYQRQSWMEPVLGANAGLFGDIQRFGSAIAEGDGEDAMKKALLLMPFGSLIRSFNHLYAED